VGEIALLADLVATLWMTGLIAFVQVVHYPLFARVGAEAFGGYHAAHCRRTTWVVFAPMVVELTTSLALLVRPSPGSGPGIAALGLAAAAVTWASTALLSVPRHVRLGSGFDPAAHRGLVATNLVRLAAWFVHAAVLVVMTARAIPPLAASG
jgi:hypothetical protein